MVTYDEQRRVSGTLEFVYLSLAVNSHSIYWAEANPALVGSILTCPINGCANGPEVVVADIGTNIQIAADEAHVYWLSDDDSALFRCPITGCATPEMIDVLQFPPYDITIDQENVYWIASGRINRFEKAGHGEPVSLAEVDASLLAVTSQSLIWFDYADATIRSCPLADCRGEPTLIATEADYMRALAADETNVYWLAQLRRASGDQAEKVQLRRVSLTGGPNQVTSLHEPQESFSRQGWHKSVTVDDDFVYWLTAGPEYAPFDFAQAGIYRLAK